MKFLFQLGKSLFIALLFCLLLEYFGAVTFCRDFKLENFLNRHLFVHLTTENIDKFAETIKRITEPLREQQTHKQAPEKPGLNQGNLNHREAT